MKTSFSFIDDIPLYLTEKPYELWLPDDQMPTDLAQTNCQFVVHSDIEVHDVREAKSSPSLESTGFQYLHSPFKRKLAAEDLLSGGNEAIEEYLLDTVNLVKKSLRADKVICFDWRYRKNQPETIDETPEYDPERRKALQPAQHVHSDDSTDGGLQRLSRHLNESELRRFSGRSLHIKFINVWRPLVDFVENSPLALCDRRTVSADDLVACDKIHPDHVNEGFYLKYRPAHRWYWLSRQTKDEPVMFVTWDSDVNVVPAGPPHSGCHNSEASSDSPPRESIEVRLMVLHEDNS